MSLPDPSPPARRRWLAAVAVLPAVAVFQLFAADFRERNSVIIDETANLTCAKDVFRRGDFSSVAYFGIGSLPILLEYGPAIAIYGDHISDVPWQTGPQDPAAARIARLTTAWVVGTGLLAVVVGWVYARTGRAWLAGWAGVVLAASPSFIAYTAVAGNDACFTLFFLLALIALGRHADRPTWGRFLVAGVAVGLAVASKYSGVLLFPAAYLLGLLRPSAAGGFVGRALLKLPLRLLGLFAVAGVVTWAATGFAWSKEPLLATPTDQPDPRPPGVLVSTLRSVRVPSPVEGFLRQGFMSTVAEKREVLVRLHGTLYPNGHPLYYVCAYLYKSTPTELLLTVVVGAAAVWWAIRRRTMGGPTAVEWAVGLGVLVLFVVLSLSVKQLGLRYLMPVYPVLVVAAAVLAAVWRRRKVVAVTVAVAAAGGQLVAAISSAPWHISYVNSLFGGPERAVDRLGNQDVAWGQGWAELNQFLVAAGEPGVLHGSGRNADLELYGVRCLPWDRYDAPPCRYITLAANGLCLNPALHPRVRHFQTLKPVRVVAHCVCLYDTADPAVWAAYNAARLEPEMIPPRSSK